jgi:methylated-DNA-[protein]-cysteine S-methyltransferase
MNGLNYTLINLSIGQVGLVWQAGKCPLLFRVILPEALTSTRSLVLRSYSDAAHLSNARIDEICAELKKYDRGEDAEFPSDLFRFDSRGNFYEQVWVETSNIPRGKVISYGEIAKRLSRPGAARAVGTALAKNPLPLIVPCHRVIKSNGELGGFSAGGTTMKRRLLEKEGVVFDSRGRALL